MLIEFSESTETLLPILKPKGEERYPVDGALLLVYQCLFLAQKLCVLCGEDHS